MIHRMNSIVGWRILEIEQIRSVAYVPISHPFIGRLISTIRREYLDHTFYWNETDLLRKLNEFKDYYISMRVHQGVEGKTSNLVANGSEPKLIENDSYRWKSHCNGLFQMPEAA